MHKDNEVFSGNEKNIDVSSLKPGVYLISVVFTAKATKPIKFVIAR